MFVRRHLLASFCIGFALTTATAPPAKAQGSSQQAAKVADEEPAENVATKAKEGLSEVTLAGGAVKFKLPKTWKSKRPRSRIVEREFGVPKVDGDASEGRLTMMRSGGSVDANVGRWIGQFRQPDGRSTKDVATVTKKKINGQEVVIVNISGTFSETMGGGPFAPGKTVTRPDYQMLGGIVQTKASGQYFFKLYGPKKTMTAAEKPFMAMMASIESTTKE